MAEWSNACSALNDCATLKAVFAWLLQAWIKISFIDIFFLTAIDSSSLYLIVFFFFNDSSVIMLFVRVYPIQYFLSVQKQ